MRICPICQTEYEDDIEFCFKDGSPLDEMGGEQPEEEAAPAPTEPRVDTSQEFLPPDANALTGESLGAVSVDLPPDPGDMPPDAGPVAEEPPAEEPPAEEPPADEPPAEEPPAEEPPAEEPPAEEPPAEEPPAEEPPAEEPPAEEPPAEEPPAEEPPAEEPPAEEPPAEEPPAEEPQAEPEAAAAAEPDDARHSITVVPGGLTSPLDDSLDDDAYREDPFSQPIPGEPAQDASAIPDPSSAETLAPEEPAAPPTLVPEEGEPDEAADEGPGDTEEMNEPPVPTPPPGADAIGDQTPAEADGGDDTPAVRESTDDEVVMDIEDEEESAEDQRSFDDPMYASIPPDDKRKKSGLMMWIIIGVTALLVLVGGGYLIMQSMGGKKPIGDGGELITDDSPQDLDTTPDRPTEKPTEDGALVEDVTDGEEITDEEDKPDDEEDKPDDEEDKPDDREDPTPDDREDPTPDEDDGTTDTEDKTEEDDGNPWDTGSDALVGKVTVSSAPLGATFFVDGQRKGSTPLTIDVPYGMHNIKVEMAPDYVAQERAISVQSGSVFVDFTLQKSTASVTGKLTVFTNPEPGATLYVDGAARGKTPITIDITQGKHTLRVELDGFPVKEETIDLSDLQPGETRRRVISMQ